MRKGSYWNSNRLSSSQQSAAIECFQEDDRCRGKMLFCTILICYRSQLIGMMEWREKQLAWKVGWSKPLHCWLWMSLETDHDKAYVRISLCCWWLKICCSGLETLWKQCCFCKMDFWIAFMLAFMSLLAPHLRESLAWKSLLWKGKVREQSDF